MAKKTKACPACKKDIAEDATTCPLCGKQLEILHWEIEQESGEKILIIDPNAADLIREQLLSGKLKLSNRCRQYIKALMKVEEGKDEYGIKKEMEWKTLKDYANSVFSLQVLYNPAGAYGKQTAGYAVYGIGAITAIGWNASALLANGAGIIATIFWSIVLLFTNLTVIGVFIVSFIISKIYDLPPFAMAFRSYIALLIGGIVGLVGGWPIGYLIGVFIGLSKKKVLA